MISHYASDFFMRSPVLLFPIVALAIFVSVFTVVSLRALLRRKSEIDALSRLPLEDETPRPDHHEAR